MLVQACLGDRRKSGQDFEHLFFQYQGHQFLLLFLKPSHSIQHLS
ncbi:hypothetical protein ES703_76967 [subsurface metagenome]